MSSPQFPDPLGSRELNQPGATASKAGLSIEERVKALELGATGRPGPGVLDGSELISETLSVGRAKWQRKICGQVYMSNSVGPSTGSAPGWLAFPASTLDTTEYERTLSGSTHFNKTTSTFTPPVTGVYRFVVSCALATTTTGQFYGVGLLLNGGIWRPTHQNGLAAGATTGFYDAKPFDQYLVAGTDVVQPAFFSSDPTSRAFVNGRRDNSFSWELVAAIPSSARIS